MKKHLFFTDLFKRPTLNIRAHAEVNPQLDTISAAYTSSHVTTWKGRALLVVRSSKKRDRVQVIIRSPLPTSALTLKTQ